MSQQTVAIDAPVAKAASAWAAFAASLSITSWTDLAAAAAFVYSMLLIGEYVWKKFLRPLLERTGWISRLK